MGNIKTAAMQGAKPAVASRKAQREALESEVAEAVQQRDFGRAAELQQRLTEQNAASVAGRLQEDSEEEDQAPAWGAQGQVPQVVEKVGCGDVHLNGPVWGTHGQVPHVVDLSNAEQQFGEALYEIKEEQKSCCSSQRMTISLRFFPNVVIYHTETQFCCYPVGYYSVAIPKHKIMGVTLSKLDACTYLKFGVPLALFGFIFFIIDVGAESPGALLWFGLVILLIGLFMIIYPCFYKKYTERIRNLFKRMFDENAATDRLIITTKEEPNSAFILHYVYGVLDKQSNGYHVISHLENDGLFKPVTTHASITDL